MNSFAKGLASYAVFNGRTARSEYWKFFAIYSIVSLVTWVADVLIGLDEMFIEIGPISAAFHVLTLLPVIGISIRRLHDTNREGWWMLVLFIPILGAIWYIVLLAREGDTAPNSYGPVPAAAASQETPPK